MARRPQKPDDRLENSYTPKPGSTGKPKAPPPSDSHKKPPPSNDDWLSEMPKGDPLDWVGRYVR